MATTKATSPYLNQAPRTVAEVEAECHERLAREAGWFPDANGLWHHDPEEYWSGTHEPLTYDNAEEVCRLRGLG